MRIAQVFRVQPEPRRQIGPETLQVPVADLVTCLDDLLTAATQAELGQKLALLEARLAGWGARPPQGELTSLRRDTLDTQLEQIRSARSLARAGYYVERLKKSLTCVKCGRFNDINLNRWQEYDDILTDSLWVIPRRDRSGLHSADYWGNYIPQIPNQMMRRYTRAGEWVLDPFLGSGTTLIECRRLGRHGLGSELQTRVAQATLERIEAQPNPHSVTTRVEVGDARALDYRDLLEQAGGRSAQLVMLHPPYHDIIRFSEDPRDLSNCSDKSAFLEGLREVAHQAWKVLDRHRFLALVIGDKYAGSEWIPLGFESMQAVSAVGFGLKSILVKNFEDTTAKRAQRELWRYRALAGGFYLFKHEYIFVFQKS